MKKQIRQTTMNKCQSLENAILESGLKSGMTVSFHHHLRNGDEIMQKVFKVIHDRGIKDLTLNVSSLSKVQDCLLPYFEDQTITQVYTSGMRGKLADYVQCGKGLKAPIVIMTHGRRASAIKKGEVHIDVTFIGASASDEVGNITGKVGQVPFGSMGYPMLDAEYADYKIALTDTIMPVEKPSIAAQYIDAVVEIDRIGNSDLIATGATRLSKHPMHQLIARKASQAIIASGLVDNGFCFQAGSGAISLLVCHYLKDYMHQHKITGNYALGGITSQLVSMLEEGYFEKLYDVQTFGKEAVNSLTVNDRHIEISADDYANPDNPNAKVNGLDVMILSATEVDVHYNVNSLTGSNGRLMGALGGAPDTAEASRLTVVVIPSMRKRIPIIVDQVQTICTKGKFVDMVVTEWGISVNPHSQALQTALDSAGIQTLSIEKHQACIEKMTGKPQSIQKSNTIVGHVQDRSGQISDYIYALK